MKKSKVASFVGWFCFQPGEHAGKNPRHRQSEFARVIKRREDLKFGKKTLLFRTAKPLNQKNNLWWEIKFFACIATSCSGYSSTTRPKGHVGEFATRTNWACHQDSTIWTKMTRSETRVEECRVRGGEVWLAPAWQALNVVLFGHRIGELGTPIQEVYHYLNQTMTLRKT
jgi:hypothetical protein